MKHRDLGGWTSPRWPTQLIPENIDTYIDIETSR